MKIYFQGLKIIFCGRIRMFFLQYLAFLLLGVESFSALLFWG